MFDFEKLDVYQLALAFCRAVEGILEGLPKTDYRFTDQLGRAALSIVLNIAEGSGRSHDKERRQFYLIARGSAFECVPLLTLLDEKRQISQERHAELREILNRVVQMLTKLAQRYEKLS